MGRRDVTVLPLLFVHRSNRTEKLADALAEVVGRPLASPLSE